MRALQSMVQGRCDTAYGMRIIAATAVLAALTGCRQDMHNQPKFVPQRGTEFYADGRSARPQVDNTVGRGQLREDSYFYTGMINGKPGDSLPFPVTVAVMQRGQERYNIYCTPCHSRVGNGVGMIVQRGYRPAGNFHTPRMQADPLGHFYDVISNGYGAMPDYAAQLTVADRWAVVAYIRALQLSQNAQASDLPAGAQAESLQVIAQREGFPVSFADEWTLPSTAVYGTPNNQDNGIPGEVTNAASAASKPATAGAGKLNGGAATASASHSSPAPTQP